MPEITIKTNKGSIAVNFLGRVYRFTPCHTDREITYCCICPDDSNSRRLLELPGYGLVTGPIRWGGQQKKISPVTEKKPAPMTYTAGDDKSFKKVEEETKKQFQATQKSLPSLLQSIFETDIKDYSPQVNKAETETEIKARANEAKKKKIGQIQSLLNRKEKPIETTTSETLANLQAVVTPDDLPSLAREIEISKQAIIKDQESKIVEVKAVLKTPETNVVTPPVKIRQQVNPSDYSIATLYRVLKKDYSDEELKAMIDLETKGKNRKTALDEIQKKIAKQQT